MGPSALHRARVRGARVSGTRGSGLGNAGLGARPSLGALGSPAGRGMWLSVCAGGLGYFAPTMLAAAEGRLRALAPIQPRARGPRKPHLPSLSAREATRPPLRPASNPCASRPGRRDHVNYGYVVFDGEFEAHASHVHQGLVRSDQLRCERIVVVQAAKDGPRDQVIASAAKSCRARPPRRLLGYRDAHQPLVRPKPVVVGDELRQRTSKMIIRQEDEVFQALSTESPDEAFNVSLGVRCTVRDWNPLDAEYAMEPGIERTAVPTWALDTSSSVLPEDAVVVVKQEPWHLAPWSSLPKLLLDPAQRRRPGHGEVNDLPGVQSHDDQDVPSREVPHHLCGEIHREDFVGVGGQETAPCRRRWPTRFHHVPPDRTRAVVHSQLDPHLERDPVLAPFWVVCGDAPDEGDVLARDSWTTRRATRTTPPVATVAFAVPPKDGLGLDDHQRVLPARPPTTEPDPDPDHAIPPSESRSRNLGVEHFDLVS